MEKQELIEKIKGVAELTKEKHYSDEENDMNRKNHYWFGNLSGQKVCEIVSIIEKSDSDVMFWIDDNSDGTSSILIKH